MDCPFLGLFGATSVQTNNKMLTWVQLYTTSLSKKKDCYTDRMGQIQATAIVPEIKLIQVSHLIGICGPPTLYIILHVY